MNHWRVQHVKGDHHIVVIMVKFNLQCSFGLLRSETMVFLALSSSTWYYFIFPLDCKKDEAIPGPCIEMNFMFEHRSADMSKDTFEHTSSIDSNEHWVEIEQTVVATATELHCRTFFSVPNVKLCSQSVNYWLNSFSAGSDFHSNHFFRLKMVQNYILDRS